MMFRSRDGRTAVDCLSKLISHCVLCFPNPVGNTRASPPSEKKKNKPPGPTPSRRTHTHLNGDYIQSPRMLWPSSGAVFSRQSPPSSCRKHNVNSDAGCTMRWADASKRGCARVDRRSVIHVSEKKTDVFFRWGRKGERSVHSLKEGGRNGGEEGVRVHPNGLRSPRVACRNLHTFFFFIVLFVCLFVLNLSGMQRWRMLSMGTQYTTMQRPHVDTLGHVHRFKIHKRRHLKYSSYRPGYTGSIW